MKTGLFFGSFNPVHHGHLVIAQYMLNFTDLQEIWFVVSPHNPFKQLADLESDVHRLKMVELATERSPRLLPSGIELDMERPSYTIFTLKDLAGKYPDRTFSLVLGSDNLEKFHLWKSFDEILEHHELYVYLREDFGGSPLTVHEKVKLFNAPLLDISSTYIRDLLHQGKKVTYLLPAAVEDYIMEHKLYKSS